MNKSCLLSRKNLWYYIVLTPLAPTRLFRQVTQKKKLAWDEEHHWSRQTVFNILLGTISDHILDSAQELEVFSLLRRIWDILLQYDRVYEQTYISHRWSMFNDFPKLQREWHFILKVLTFERFLTFLRLEYSINKFWGWYLKVSRWRIGLFSGETNANRISNLIWRQGTFHTLYLGYHPSPSFPFVCKQSLGHVVHWSYGTYKPQNKTGFVTR